MARRECTTTYPYLHDHGESVTLELATGQFDADTENVVIRGRFVAHVLIFVWRKLEGVYIWLVFVSCRLEDVGGCLLDEAYKELMYMKSKRRG